VSNGTWEGILVETGKERFGFGCSILCTGKRKKDYRRGRKLLEFGKMLE